MCKEDPYALSTICTLRKMLTHVLRDGEREKITNKNILPKASVSYIFVEQL